MEKTEGLRYGDIVQLTAPSRGGKPEVFFLAYMDPGKEMELRPQNPHAAPLFLSHDAQQGWKSEQGDVISQIQLLDRDEKKRGFVAQNELLHGQPWVLQVSMNGQQIPVRGTIGQVDLDSDTATFIPDDETLGKELELQFGFKGLPKWIARIDAVEEEEEQGEDEQREEKQGEAQEEGKREEEREVEELKRGEQEQHGGEPEDENVYVEEDVTWSPDKWSTEVVQRVPSQILHPTIFKPSVVEDSFVLNSREKFVQFINSLLTQEQLLQRTSDKNSFPLMKHQQVVRNYLNMYTPYRGLLLYHGLGAGKTCTSIAVAEGMKSSKKVLVLTPASLRWNYMEELKKCGDVLYKRQQFWEWIDARQVPEDVLLTISAIVRIPVADIRTQGGVWFINVQKPSNYDQLDRKQQQSLERQLDYMIQRKYAFISYNGLSHDKLSALTNRFTENMFDHAVVIIDEAHNFVSRIVNKLRLEHPQVANPASETVQGSATSAATQRRPKTLSVMLYDMLMRAVDCRIVMLTGTPMVNFPNEIGVLFNILRGYIRTWRFTLQLPRRYTLEEIRQILAENNALDYVDYSSASHVLTVTKNPYGFVNTRDGYVRRKEDESPDKGMDVETVDDDTGFVAKIVQLLARHNIEVKRVELQYKKALPDRLDDFVLSYIDEVGLRLKNEEAFKRRIIGLTSYFEDQEEVGDLLPLFDKDKDFHVVRVPMSALQFFRYKQERLEEIEQEKQKKMKRRVKKQIVASSATGELFEKNDSTFRIFSRLACNFFVPDRVKPAMFQAAAVGHKTKTAKVRLPEEIEEQPADDDGSKRKKRRRTQRQTSTEEETEETEQNLDQPPEMQQQAMLLEDIVQPDVSEELAGEMEGDTALQRLDQDYATALKSQLIELAQKHPNIFVSASESHPQGQLQEYSPKFAAVLDKLQDPAKTGTHLVYSQFRTAEGIGLLTKVLLANGYTEFKLKKQHGVWSVDCVLQFPMYALYTGTEQEEEKEMVRRIFNSDWQDLPPELSTPLKAAQGPNENLRGEIIQTLLITSSGSEGITLKNVRWVHILDPYWHPVRMEQIIGRTRRINSHQRLPKRERQVEVFLYLAVLTEAQKRTLGEAATTDEYLFDISERKALLNARVYQAIQESAFDCFLHDKKKKLRCLNFAGDLSAYDFAFVPDYSNQNADGIVAANRVRKEFQADGQVTVGTKEFAYKKADHADRIALYDLGAYKRGQVLPVGRLVRGKDQKYRLVTTLEKGETEQDPDVDLAEEGALKPAAASDELPDEAF